MTPQERILQVLGGGKVTRAKRQAATFSPQAQIRAGLGFAALEALQQRYHIPLAQLQKVIGISDRTLARRREQQQFNQAESDRLYRLARIATRAEEVLGSITAAEHWLKESIPTLSNETPLSLLDTDEGAQQVGDLLGRIEHGVYS